MITSVAESVWNGVYTYNWGASFFENGPFMEFMHLAITCGPDSSYCRWLRCFVAVSHAVCVMFAECCEFRLYEPCTYLHARWELLLATQVPCCLCDVHEFHLSVDCVWQELETTVQGLPAGQGWWRQCWREQQRQKWWQPRTLSGPTATAGTETQHSRTCCHTLTCPSLQPSIFVSRGGGILPYNKIFSTHTPHDSHSFKLDMWEQKYNK